MTNGSSASLVSLPLEILEKIARMLDEASLPEFAVVHPRFKDTCNRLLSLRRVSSRHVHPALIRLVAFHAWRIRTLDMSNCCSDSKRMASLIEKCLNLSELNVLNSFLTPQHLVDVLGNLGNLKKLRATVVDTDPHFRLGEYPNIRSIYIEFGPKQSDAQFVINFLEACPNSKKLVLSVVGNAESPLPRTVLDEYSDSDPMSKYETLVIYTSMGSKWTCEEVLRLIFGWTAEFFNLLSVNKQDNVFSFGRQVPMYGKATWHSEREVIAFPGSANDDRTVGFRVKKHSSAYRGRMYIVRDSSSLREVDFVQCHLQQKAEFWRSLVESLPGIEALALSSCSLFGSPESLTVDESVLKALAGLRLKKLHVETTDGDCARCTGEINGTLMMHLRNFESIEEFSLHRARVSEDFLDHLDGPLPLRTLKLHVDSLGSERKLLFFLDLCGKLRNLKLEALDLPLASASFWEALSEASLLKLCLSTTVIGLADPSVLRLSIFWLFKTLQVFHLHARDAPGSKLESMIEEEARAANDEGTIDPLTFIVNQHSLSSGRLPHGLKFPGRGLCCMENLIGAPRPIGWETDSPSDF